MQSGSWGSDNLHQWTESPCKLICREKGNNDTDTRRKVKRGQSIVLGLLSSNPSSILHFHFQNLMHTVVILYSTPNLLCHYSVLHLFFCHLSPPLAFLILHLVYKLIHSSLQLAFFPLSVSKMLHQFCISSVLISAPWICLKCYLCLCPFECVFLQMPDSGFSL